MITKEFLTAGQAIFTVSNPSGEHYTYKVSAPYKQSETNPFWFVKVLTGPDNTRDYTYAGLLQHTGNLVVTAKSKYKSDSKPFLVAKWAISVIWGELNIPDGYKIQHEGRCGRCGRSLTDPTSIETGLGPICAGRN